MDEIQKRRPTGSSGGSSKKIAGLVILAFILGLMYIHNLQVDARREAELNKFMRTHGPGSITHENYAYIESLNVSRTKKTNAAVLLGFIRGAIIGAALGGDAGSMEGMLSFGVLNGILFWVSEHLSERV